MTSITVLWVYIVLLVIGGLMGYLKAKSRVSLYMALGFAAALALCAIRILPLVAADWLMAALLVVFGLRLAKTKKFMPAGLMLAVTILALAGRHLVA
jgi:uncharacterized membrane protein (UPF0136 family)